MLYCRFCYPLTHGARSLETEQSNEIAPCLMLVGLLPIKMSFPSSSRIGSRTSSSFKVHEVKEAMLLLQVGVVFKATPLPKSWAV